jgi:chorismate mutase-like protein
LRKQIDRLDERLLRLLNTRAGLAARVGELKKRKGLPLFDPRRERQILRRLIRANGGPLPAASIEAIFREVLRQARRLARSV